VTPFEFTLQEHNAGLEALASIVPAPQQVPYMDGFVMRYVEKTDQQAIVLKLARLISCVRAAEILLRTGHLQELGMLQRVLDETNENITFLCGPFIGGAREARHDQFLEYFWQEEFDEGVAPMDAPQKRGMVSRDKIIAYNARTMPGGDPSTNSKATTTLHKTYSGFVHGAAPHIMDLYGGDPPRFQTAGLLGTSRMFDSMGDFANYPYRALMTCAVAAKALGSPVFDRLYKSVQTIGKATGLGE
jgi:hypothetical protein